MSSYGGNLSLVQEGDGQGGSIKSSTAIMTGNRASLHYIRDPEEAGVTRRISVKQEKVSVPFVQIVLHWLLSSKWAQT